MQWTHWGPTVHADWTSGFRCFHPNWAKMAWEMVFGHENGSPTHIGHETGRAFWVCSLCLYVVFSQANPRKCYTENRKIWGNLRNLWGFSQYVLIRPVLGSLGMPLGERNPGQIRCFLFLHPRGAPRRAKKCTSAQGAAVSLGKLHRDQSAVLQADHHARIEVQFST